MPLPSLHARVARASLEAAGAAIGDDLETDYMVELVRDEPTARGYRVTRRDGTEPPRYYAVQVVEVAVPNAHAPA
jgi:hypothetical protein